MPNMSAHMAVAKRVSEYLKIDDNNFFKGSLLPDLFDDKNKSHYKIQGKIYLIPDIDYVKNNLDMNDKINVGVLTHLLLDKYYLEEYLTNKYKKNIIDGSKLIYNDYDILNKDIIEHFDLDINNLNEILINYKQDINKEKLEYNINCLSLNKKGKTVYLNKKDFINFLEEISKVISEEIKNFL